MIQAHGYAADNPQSPLRPDAKLGVGDSFLGEHSTEALITAATEFREFLTFYPTNPRADYAQYKVAMSHYEQMRAPEREAFTRKRRPLGERAWGRPASSNSTAGWRFSDCSMRRRWLPLIISGRSATI